MFHTISRPRFRMAELMAIMSLTSMICIFFIGWFLIELNPWGAGNFLSTQFLPFFEGSIKWYILIAFLGFVVGYTKSRSRPTKIPLLAWARKFIDGFYIANTFLYGGCLVAIALWSFLCVPLYLTFTDSWILVHGISAVIAILIVALLTNFIYLILQFQSWIYWRYADIARLLTSLLS